MINFNVSKDKKDVTRIDRVTSIPSRLAKQDGFDLPQSPFDVERALRQAYVSGFLDGFGGFFVSSPPFKRTK